VDWLVEAYISEKHIVFIFSAEMKMTNKSTKKVIIVEPFAIARHYL
jgi:hypothetical protein